jgi:hypothetical protein
MELSRVCLAAAFGCAFASQRTRAEPAPPEPPPARFHLGLGAGLGTAYDGLGLNLQVRGDHFGIYLGTGALGFLGGPIFDVNEGSSSAGLCAGLRWFRGEGEGLFVSLNGSYARFSSHYDPGVAQSQVVSGSASTATAVIGGRGRSGSFFFEAGLGGGIGYTNTPPHGYTGSPPPGTRNSTSLTLIPDVLLGMGLEF